MSKKVPTALPRNSKAMSNMMAQPICTPERNLQIKEHKREIRRKLQDMADEANQPRELW